MTTQDLALVSLLALPALTVLGEGPRVTTLPLDSELPSSGRLGGVAADARGNLYVANFSASVWRIDPAGHVERLPVTLQGSSGNAVDRDGNLYQAGFVDGRIVRVTPDGEAETWISEGLDGPVGVTVAEDGSLFVCNCRANSIVRIDPDRRLKTVAKGGDLDCPNGIALDVDGGLVVVSFKNGHVVRIAADGSMSRMATLPGVNAHVAVTREALYITQVQSHRVYRVDRVGQVTPYAGSGSRGFEDGPLTEATLAHPNGIAVSSDGAALWIDTLDGERLGSKPTRIILRRIDLPSEPGSGAAGVGSPG